MLSFLVYNIVEYTFLINQKKFMKIDLTDFFYNH